MDTLANIIREKRIAMHLKMIDLSVQTHIDQALLSKFESGGRVPTDMQLLKLSEALQIDLKLLRKLALAEKVYKMLKDEEYGADVLHVAEARIEFLNSSKAKSPAVLSDDLKELLDEIDKLQTKYAHTKSLKGIRKQKMKEYISIQYTYESNKIEGNTLSLSETSLIIKEGITISGKTVKEHLEALNHNEAIEFLYDMVTNDAPYHKYNLLQLHNLILRGIDKKYAGRYRDVPVRITGAKHIPPEPFLIEKLMEEYFEYYEKQKNSLHPVILAAELHERLVSIHPFIDGNGRTSRLVMNLMLLSRGYPIAILKGDYNSRMRYYRALESIQIDNESEAFYLLVCEAVRDSLKEHIELSI